MSLGFSINGWGTQHPVWGCSVVVGPSPRLDCVGGPRLHMCTCKLLFVFRFVYAPTVKCINLCTKRALLRDWKMLRSLLSVCKHCSLDGNIHFGCVSVSNFWTKSFIWIIIPNRWFDSLSLIKIDQIWPWWGMLHPYKYKCEFRLLFHFELSHVSHIFFNIYFL